MPPTDGTIVAQWRRNCYSILSPIQYRDEFCAECRQTSDEGRRCENPQQMRNKVPFGCANNRVKLMPIWFAIFILLRCSLLRRSGLICTGRVAISLFISLDHSHVALCRSLALVAFKPSEICIFILECVVNLRFNRWRRLRFVMVGMGYR